MRTRPLVVVSQPYVPSYRVPLFDAIRGILLDEGVELVIAAGEPKGIQAARGDNERPKWRSDLDIRTFRIRTREVHWRKLPGTLRSPDVLVSELEALNTLAWKASFSRTKLILWGHGAPYVNDSGTLADQIEWALARRAESVMTYAEGGKSYLTSRGKISPRKITVIGNSTDTESLRSAYESITPDDLRSLKDKWPDAPRALFVGGLDHSKRIEFLVDAAIAAKELDARFSLIVVGKGADEYLLSRAGSAIKYVPAARGAALAQLGRVTQCIWMPGRIGLVAADALAMGLPVLTTDYDSHAPEAEFLRPGERYDLPNTPAEFASQALLLMQPLVGKSRSLREDIPSVDSVSRAFASVVLRTLNNR